MAASIEFVRIAGYPVKVTSLARAGESGCITLVVITRGSSDRNHLNDLLGKAPLTLELPEEPALTVDVDSVDARSVGEGEQAITRFSIRFRPAKPSELDVTVERDLETRLEEIERKLDLILQELALRRSDNRVE